MKKKTIALMLAVVLTLALVTTAAAEPAPDTVTPVTGVGDNGITFTRSTVTANDYLGYASIGNLWSGDYEMKTWIFNVYIVDDDVYSFEVVGYLSDELDGYILMNDGSSSPDLYTENGKVMIYGSMDAYEGTATKDNPYTYEFYISEDAWMPQAHYLNLYDTDYEYRGFFDMSAIIFTKSQFAHFKNTGELPPMKSIWGMPDNNDDLSALADLTELKALLNEADIKLAAPTEKTALPTASAVYVYGEEMSFEAYNIDGYNYFKLRDLAAALNGSIKQFSVGYDETTKAITLTSGESYTAAGGEMTKGDGNSKSAVKTDSKIYLNGYELNLTAYNIGGNNFFKLRDLMNELGVYVGYDDETKVITLESTLTAFDGDN